MDLTALQTRCKTRFRDTNCEIYVNADWTDYLNDAYRDTVARTRLWPFLEASSVLTFAAGARTHALPTDVFTLNAVYNVTDETPLVPMEGRTEKYKVWPEQTETGPPLQYNLIGTTLEIFPLPEQQTCIKIEYIGGPTMLSSGSDVPVFPSQYHHMLVEGALARAYEDDGNLNQSQVHATRFSGLLEELVQHLLAERNDRWPEIVDNYWG